jgi:hypothetical protein
MDSQFWDLAEALVKQICENLKQVGREKEAREYWAKFMLISLNRDLALFRREVEKIEKILDEVLQNGLGAEKKAGVR